MREICASKWVGLDKKNSCKYEDNSLTEPLKITNPNNFLWAYIREGLLSEVYLRLRFWGRRRGGGEVIMGILRC